DVAAVDLDVALEAAVHGVVLQHVGQVVGLQQIVDRDDLDVAAEILDRRTQHVAPDAAEAVDAYPDRHVAGLLACLMEAGRRNGRKTPKPSILPLASAIHLTRITPCAFPAFSPPPCCPWPPAPPPWPGAPWA